MTLTAISTSVFTTYKLCGARSNASVRRSALLGVFYSGTLIFFFYLFFFLSPEFVFYSGTLIFSPRISFFRSRIDCLLSFFNSGKTYIASRTSFKVESINLKCFDSHPS